MNTNFITDWKYRCPRCGQEQSDVARMKRHYARVKPCKGVYNPETKKYEGQPIEDIPWKVLQDGIGVVSRKSKVAEKKAKEAKVKAEKERLANMTYYTCPLIFPDDDFIEDEDNPYKDDILHKLFAIIRLTYFETGYVTEVNHLTLFVDEIKGKNIKTIGSYTSWLSSFWEKLEKYMERPQDKIYFTQNEKTEILEYQGFYTDRLEERIEYFWNIAPNINNEELDHIPFYLKYNEKLDLWTHPFNRKLCFSRRTLLIHNKITGEWVGSFKFEPKEWNKTYFSRNRTWGGCPSLYDCEILH